MQGWAAGSFVVRVVVDCNRVVLAPWGKFLFSVSEAARKQKVAIGWGVQGVLGAVLLCLRVVHICVFLTSAMVVGVEAECLGGAKHEAVKGQCHATGGCLRIV